MKIAILSDIHGNLPALEAVLEALEREPPDLCLLNGDVINRGPDSSGALRLLQAHQPGAVYLKGNHEAWVLRCRDEGGARSGVRFEVKQFAYWTVDQLGEGLEAVREWPDQLDLTVPGGGQIHCTHGSRLGNRDGLGPRVLDAELPAKLGEKRDLFLASHTHVPMVRSYAGTLIVNSGSVGAPFDRDARASFARVSLSGGRWGAEIVRLPYDRAATERLYRESGFLEGGGALTRLLLRELQLSRGLMGPWMRRYQPAVVEGTMTLDASIGCILDEVS